MNIWMGNDSNQMDNTLRKNESTQIDNIFVDKLHHLFGLYFRAAEVSWLDNILEKRRLHNRILFQKKEDYLIEYISGKGRLLD